MRLEMVSRRLHFDLVQSWSSAAKSGAISDTSLHDESVKTLFVHTTLAVETHQSPFDKIIVGSGKMNYECSFIIQDF